MQNTIDADEIEAIKTIVSALQDKTPEQQMRLLRWAADTFCGCTLAYKPETKNKPL